MIKILHTADWHLGKKFYKWDRLAEQREMLEQMGAILEAERPDVLLVCGDIFDVSQPGSEVQSILADTLTEWHETWPALQMVLISGNHDSGSRHEIFKRPLKSLNIHLIGTLQADDLGSHIVEVAGKGIIAAVPYTNEYNLPDDFFDRLLAEAQQRSAAANLPVVLAAHATVLGCDKQGHDLVEGQEMIVGGLESVELSRFGTGYDYLALGHIHKPQFVDGDGGRVRYSGTPLAINFTETYEHSVSIVEIEAHGARPVVREVAIHQPRPLVNIPAVDFAPWDDVLEELRNFPDDLEAYIRLNVIDDDSLPRNPESEAIAITEGKQCRICPINRRPLDADAQSELKTLTLDQFRAQRPIEIAKKYTEAKNIEFGEDLQELFEEIYAEVVKKLAESQK